MFRWCGPKATTIIIEWPTDQDGALVRERFFAREHRVRLMDFTPATFDALQRTLNDFHGSAHDIRTDGKYWMPTRESILFMIMEKPEFREYTSLLLSQVAEVLRSLGHPDTAAVYIDCQNKTT
jgi:hypothetical protein